MSFLHLQSLAKTYPRAERPAVQDINLTVDNGQFFSLVGESGSGKTTLLRLITGLEWADEGTIRLDSRTLTAPGVHLPPEKRSVGLVFQHHVLFPHLTVGQNITFGIHGLPAKERRDTVASLLDLAGMPGHAARYPHELSGGERQRVALVRALAPRPKLLLLDEPFSSLDTHLRESLRDETHRLLQKHGTTSILVTHHTQDALAVSDRIAVLRHGVMEQAGTPAEIYEHPATAYVATLFGPCNFLPASFSSLLNNRAWVRPEHLALHPQKGGNPSELSGVVSQITFAGDHRQVTLCCHAGTGEATEIRVCERTESDLKPGDRCVIRLRSEGGDA